MMAPASSSGLGTQAAGQCPEGMAVPGLGLDLQSGPLSPQGAAASFSGSVGAPGLGSQSHGEQGAQGQSRIFSR